MLNGHYQVSVFRQQIPVIGAVLDYSGSDTAVERINSSGPIGVDIYLHVLSVGNLHPPDVRYYYLVSNDASRRTETTQYLWRILDTWENCSAICQG